MQIQHEGEATKTHSFFVWGERVSAIACISMAGLWMLKLLKEPVIYSFVHTHLLPQLISVPEVVKSIQDVGGTTTRL